MARLRARATFAATVDDTAYLIREGEVVDSRHPVVKGREQLFTPTRPEVEQATAAPGEKRRR